MSSVKVWACNSGCYDSSFYAQGGSVVNGTYAQLDDLPFYTEYQDNPALAALVKQMGGTANLNNNAVLSYVMCLLFQDAVQKATANGGTLDRRRCSPGSTARTRSPPRASSARPTWAVTSCRTAT